MAVRLVYSGSVPVSTAKTDNRKNFSVYRFFASGGKLFSPDLVLVLQLLRLAPQETIGPG